MAGQAIPIIRGAPGVNTSTTTSVCEYDDPSRHGGQGGGGGLVAADLVAAVLVAADLVAAARAEGGKYETPYTTAKRVTNGTSSVA